MITLEQRHIVLQLITEACSAGARLQKACALIGLAARTLQRWLAAGPQAQQVGDRRTLGQRVHNCPQNKLSDAERVLALSVLNSDEFKDLPPARSCPAWQTLADTWGANRRCTSCCARQGNWPTDVSNVHLENAANPGLW